MITKIQSFTDVITNSSSTVFVMNEINAEYYDKLPNTNGCIDIYPITKEWLYRHPDEIEMVCSILDIDISTITTQEFNSWWTWWKPLEQSDWEKFLDSYENLIEEKFSDLYWVDIEDHFVDASDVTESAYDDALWYESRH
jgi:hypothetical protein